MRSCSIEGCGRKHHARGLCQKHYGQATYEPHPVVRWVNPLTCLCPVPVADLRVNFGECAVCRRKPLALMAVAS